MDRIIEDQLDDDRYDDDFADDDDFLSPTQNFIASNAYRRFGKFVSYATFILGSMKFATIVGIVPGLILGIVATGIVMVALEIVGRALELGSFSQNYLDEEERRELDRRRSVDISGGVVKVGAGVAAGYVGYRAGRKLGEWIS